MVNTSALARAESFMRVGAGPDANHTLGLVASPASVPVSANTLSTASVTTTTAVLNGTVNANGSSATAYFDYGLDITYGTNATATPYAVSGSTASAVSTTLTGLSPATTYHFRANGSNGSGTAHGADMTFTTLNAYLSALDISSGTMTPPFNPMVFDYHAAVDASVSNIAFTATAADSQATVTINGTPVVFGTASMSIPLVYGDNTIKVVVTASDHISTQSYGITVTRAIPASLTVAYSSGTDVPIIFNGFTATGSTVDFVLNYAPAPGTTLVVVHNTGLGFISGTFSNLAHGQAVNLNYNGTTFPFMASYYGGTGNDLVLIWAKSRPLAWGYNLDGQLGNNSTNSSNTPTAVTTAGTPLAGRTLLALSAGDEHSLALCSDGTLATWGSNSYGQLGNSSISDQKVPVAVNTSGTALAGRTVAAVSAGANHNLVLCSDGTLVAWGSNSNGQLGNGTTTSSNVPVAVNTAGTPMEGKKIVAADAGSYHCLALCSDGTLATWGFNTYGQLGNNAVISSSIPVPVTTAGTALAGKTVISIASGMYHNLVLCSDGTLVTWGANFYGQLGNKTTTPSSVPVAVTTAGTALAGKTVIAIGAGADHCLVLCSDGTMAAWGSNVDGELGNDSSAYITLPVALSTSGALAGKTVLGFSAGNFLSLARCSDGSVAAWGANNHGQLGNASTSNSSTIPVEVASSPLALGETFMQVAAGPSANHVLVLAASPVPVSTTTLAATFVSSTTAVLNGIGNANGSTAAVSFDLGQSASYNTNVAATPATVTGSAITNVNTTLTGLTPSTTYHFRVKATNGSGTVNGADLTFTTLPMTRMQIWRQACFGTTAGDGNLANAADYDGDGIPNLMEYALNLSPTSVSMLPVTTALNGANFEYTYSRGTLAATSATTYAVEWSSVLPSAWSTNGVTQTVLSDDGTTQVVKATIPVNAAVTMFIRLSVTSPP